MANSKRNDLNIVIGVRSDITDNTLPVCGDYFFFLNMSMKWKRHYKKDTCYLLDLYTLTFDNHESLESLGEYVSFL